MEDLNKEMSTDPSIFKKIQFEAIGKSVFGDERNHIKQEIQNKDNTQKSINKKEKSKEANSENPKKTENSIETHQP